MFICSRPERVSFAEQNLSEHSDSKSIIKKENNFIMPKKVKSTHERRKIAYEGLVELKEAILSNKNLVLRPKS